MAMMTQDFEQYDALVAEQENLGANLPVMKHSFSEGSKEMVFHAHIIADFNTLVELTNIFIDDLEEGNA